MVDPPGIGLPRVYPISVIGSEMLWGLPKYIGSAGWPYFADPEAACLRRSGSGSISAITIWLHFADHNLA